MTSASELGLLFKITADSKTAETDIKRFSNVLVAETKQSSEAALQSLGTIGKGLNALEGPAGLAALGIAGIGAAAMGAAASVLSLAKSAASYASEIGSAQAKTGLSAESLSTLRYATELAGKELSDFTSAFPKFQKLLAEAAQGSTVAAEKLQRLHIDKAVWADQDKALEGLFNRINALQNPIERTKALQDAFGRSGADLSSVFKKVGGDFDAFKRQAADLGLVLGQQDVQSAKEFNAAYKKIEVQVADLKYQFGKELLPVLKGVFTDFGGWLKNNKSEVETWGKGTANAVSNVVAAFKELIQFYDSHPILASILPGGGASLTLRNLAASGPYSQPKPATRDQIEGRTPAAEPSETDYNADLKAAEDARKAREKAREEELKNQKEHLKLMLQAERNYLDEDQKGFEDAYRKKEITEDEFSKISDANLEIYAAKAKKIILDQFKLDAQGETPSGVANLRLVENQANAAIDKEVAKEREDREKLLTGDHKTAEEKRVTDSKESYEQNLEDFKQAQEKKLALAYKLAEEIGISEANQARTSELLQVQTLEKKKALLQTYQSSLLPDSKEYRQAELDIARTETEIETTRARNAGNEAKRQREALTAEKELHKEQIRRWNDDIKNRERDDAEEQRGIDLKNKEFEDSTNRKRPTAPGTIGGGIAGSVGVQLPSIFDPKNVGIMKTQAQYIKDVYADLAQSSGQALGSMIDGLANLATQWLTTGQFSAKAALQMASGILMGLAIQSGVKAIFEFAEASASAAVMDYRGAALHTAAAHLYLQTAAIAGAFGIGTGLASRALGGGGGSAQGSFNQQTTNNSNNDPNSRSNRFSSPFGGYTSNTSDNGQREVNRKILAVLGATHDAVTEFTDKFGPVTPGHVVMAGASDAGPAIFNAHAEHLETQGAGAASRLGRALVG